MSVLSLNKRARDRENFKSDTADHLTTALSLAVSGGALSAIFEEVERAAIAAAPEGSVCIVITNASCASASSAHQQSAHLSLAHDAVAECQSGSPPDRLLHLTPRGPASAVATGNAIQLRAAALGIRTILTVPAGKGDTQPMLVLMSPAKLVEGDATVVAARAAARQLDMLLQAHDAVSTVTDVGKRFSLIAGMVPGVLYQRRVQPDGKIRYTYISENAFDLFGVTAERILTDPEALFMHYSPAYRDSFRQKLLKASRDMSMWDVEATILRPDGETRYTHAIARPAKEPDGSVLWTGVILDSTRIKVAEMTAAAAEVRTRNAIVESLSQGLLMFDKNDQLTVRNSHFDKLYPSMASIAVPGAQYGDVIRAELDPELNPDVVSFDANDELVDRLMRHGESHLVYERTMDGDRHILVNEYKTDNCETVILYTDISEMKRRERKIEHLAHHDSLTGLPNRVLFNQRLQEMMSGQERGAGRVAVMCLDLDRFKSVNDTLGHQIGDRLLIEVARRIEAALRTGDMASRLGGDEFAIIIPNVTDPEALTMLSYRLLKSFAEPFDLDGHAVVSGTSIGISLSEQDSDDAEVLLKNADLALYRAKADGRGTFRFFEAEMDAKAQSRRLLEMALRVAIARNELEVHYQPLVDAHNAQVMGAEALLRWNRNGAGYVPPLDFVPLAEETGLITEIGEWVLRRACTDAASWPDDIRIAVNISPAQFRNPQFACVVKGILEEAGLHPNRLELEITESMLLRNSETNLQILRDLKAMGVRVSMDDFGTGYSSLGNLRSFPFDKIKIDKSFIGDLNKSPDAAAIIRAILALGRSLGMTTTAEGVETRDQLSYLRAEGCVEVQGHYFAKALTANDFTDVLAKNSFSGQRALKS